MRAITITLAALLALAATACGGVSGRAAWPDVASTDRSADDLGLPSVGGSSTPDASDPDARSEGPATSTVESSATPVGS